MKKFDVVIIGLGARGYHTYGRYQHIQPERMNIVAIADVDKEKLDLAGKEFNVPMDKRFNSAEDILSMPKMADVAIIATQDCQHYAHAMKALELGYNLLLEKPIAMTPYECVKIRDKAVDLNRLVVVCHVLRYTTFYRTIKSLMAKIGKTITVQAIENVGYWHQAHSFVRGNWNNDTHQTPMTVQKCCHDFDIIAWLLDKKCTNISSYGSLSYFKEENAPKGSTKMCCDCPYIDSCLYSTKNIYFDQNEVGFNKGNRDWPIDIVCEKPTKEKLENALKESKYGRCVFRCDNNVVDHQITNMLFDDGVTASLTMTAFTAKNYRYIKIMGTQGEIIADQDKNIVTLYPFNGQKEIYDINKIATDLSGHGGGDNCMMCEMFDALEKGGAVSSCIQNSVATHMMAYASEVSRLNNGNNIILEDFEKSVLESMEK